MVLSNGAWYRIGCSASGVWQPSLDWLAIELPDSRQLGLPDESFLAVPVDGEVTVFRLVRRQVPDERDFKIVDAETAQIWEDPMPDIERCGYSVFDSFENADNVRWQKGSRIAPIILREGRMIYLAKAEYFPKGAPAGHRIVWGYQSDLLDGCGDPSDPLEEQRVRPSD
jgi:hypothetical protein